MSATFAPYGLICAKHPSGQSRANAYSIASGYAANIFTGDPVKLDTAGVVQLATSDGTRTGTTDTVDILGVFAGCQYTDATGKPNWSPFWPSGQVATNVVAWVYDDPANVYAIQANGPIPATAVGDQADFTNFAAPGGSVMTGFSSVALGTLVGAGVQGQLRVVDLHRLSDNAWGDSFTQVLVQIAEHTYVAEKAAV